MVAVSSLKQTNCLIQALEKRCLTLSLTRHRLSFGLLKRLIRVVYLWRHFYYIFEVIKHTDKGNWYRITSPEETHYVFMLKTSMPDVSKFVGVKNAVSTLN